MIQCKYILPMRFDHNTVVFCCGGGKCPTINKISDDEFRLTDDHGGSVKLNKQELEYMAENFSSAVDSLKKETI